MLAATGLVAAVVAFSACSRDSGPRASSSAPTTTLEPGTSAPPSTSTTTTVASTTTAVTSRPTATSPAASPEGHAKAFYDAWTRGDRAAAHKVAQPQAVDALFARQWREGDGWSFVDCSGAAGSVICTWQRPGGQLLVRVQSVTGGVPVAVSDVRFQP